MVIREPTESSRSRRGFGCFFRVNVSGLFPSQRGSRVAPQAALPIVTASKPLQRALDTRLGFLGQFSAVDKIELRAQVGGVLTEIHFKDGQIVHKGDLL